MEVTKPKSTERMWQNLNEKKQSPASRTQFTVTTAWRQQASKDSKANQSLITRDVQFPGSRDLQDQVETHVSGC
jgi:hypothetical protein